MRVLILANGDPPSIHLAQEQAARHDFLIATDGAAHRAAGLGLRPNLICGDFDSVEIEVAKREFPDAEFVETPDQNFADLEKALHLARERGARAVTFLGAGGGRIDHTLTTIALLLRYHAEIPLTLADDHGAVWAVSGAPDSAGTLDLEVTPGDTISLIAFDSANQVTLVGVEWPLEDQCLPVGTHGVSNIAQSERVSVQVTRGALLVCHLRNENVK